jgi:uncharacterized membrane protein
MKNKTIKVINTSYTTGSMKCSEYQVRVLTLFEGWNTLGTFTNLKYARLFAKTLKIEQKKGIDIR